MARSPADPIKKARKKLEPAVFGRVDLEGLAKKKSEGKVNHHSFYRSQIPITGEIVPEVDSALDDACENLGIPREIVHGFIERSGEVNATCYSSSLIEGHAIVSITSAAVERLCYDEMVYVFGHELGHHIFPHAYAKDANGRVASYEDSQIARRMELFMDRIGLIACRKLAFATSAAMKIASGLGSAHLRTNVHEYSKETHKGFDAPADFSDLVASHPPLYMRIRAISLFAQSDAFLGLIEKEGGRPVTEVNKEVEADLLNSVDMLAEKKMHELVSDVPNFFMAYARVKGDNITPEILSLPGIVVVPKEVDEWFAKMKKIPADKLDEAFTDKLKELSIRAAITCPRFALAYSETLLSKLDGKQIKVLVEAFAKNVMAAWKRHLEEKSYRYGS